MDRVDKYLAFKDFPKIAVGLNIEGYHPARTLPQFADWFNIILAVDEPLNGITFDDVMQSVKENKYQYIEQAIPGFDLETYIDRMVLLINRIKKDYNNVLIHVHQYTGTTILDKILQERTGVYTILDVTNFHELPVNYKERYPKLDCLISISQCAALDSKAGDLIIANSWYDYNVKKGELSGFFFMPYNEDRKKYFEGIPYKIGTILVVDDLWNPTKHEIESDGVYILGSHLQTL